MVPGENVVKFRFLLLLLFSLLHGPANALYSKYSDIASSVPNDQNMYISGGADALALNDNTINICLARSLKMKAGQLATNVMAFAASRPALHSRSMADVVAAYLREACPQ
jgi:hypothetical protein